MTRRPRIHHRLHGFYLGVHRRLASDLERQRLALHTPLMSVTNAISGIIIVGGMVQVGVSSEPAALILGAFAVFVATINIAGGFLVTHRMLKMFRK